MKKAPILLLLAINFSFAGPNSLLKTFKEKLTNLSWKKDKTQIKDEATENNYDTNEQEIDIATTANNYTAKLKRQNSNVMKRFSNILSQETSRKNRTSTNRKSAISTHSEAVTKFNNIIKKGMNEISKNGFCDTHNIKKQIQLITPTMEDFIKVTKSFLNKITQEKLKKYVEYAFSKQNSDIYDYLHEYCDTALTFLGTNFNSNTKIINNFCKIIPDNLKHLAFSQDTSLKRKVKKYLTQITSSSNFNNNSSEFPSFAEFVNEITQILSINEDILAYELVIRDKTYNSTKQVYTYNLCVLKAISKMYNFLKNKK